MKPHMRTAAQADVHTHVHKQTHAHTHTHTHTHANANTQIHRYKFICFQILFLATGFYLLFASFTNIFFGLIEKL